MIETHELTKQFHDFLAVDEVNLSVDAGQILAILGQNGAGKTTTVRMLTALLNPTRGWARVAGYDVVKNGHDVRSSVGVLTEQHGLYMRMTAIEYLDFFTCRFCVDTLQVNDLNLDESLLHHLSHRSLLRRFAWIDFTAGYIPISILQACQQNLVPRKCKSKSCPAYFQGRQLIGDIYPTFTGAGQPRNISVYFDQLFHDGIEGRNLLSLKYTSQTLTWWSSAKIAPIVTFIIDSSRIF